MKKKLFALGMATAIAITSAASVSAIDIGPTPVPTSDELDTLDVLISASLCMNTASEDMWPNHVQIDELVPLYSPSGDQVAWYLTLSSGEYAVVHNDKDNPAVIEFGDGGNRYIDNLVNSNYSSRIIYNSPWDVYSLGNNASSSIDSDEENLYVNYPELKNNNPQLAYNLEISRNQILTENSQIEQPYGDGDYGFIEWGDLPAGVCHSSTLSTSGIDWAVMEDYNNIASDHCAATCATNIVAYFDYIGYDLLENNSIDDTFEVLYSLIGRGPVFGFTINFEAYCKSHGYSVDYSYLDHYSSIQTAISDDNPVALMLGDGVLNMHWVLCIGWREYEPQFGGGEYLQVITGWKEELNRYYLMNTGSLFLDAVEFWIE